MNVAVALLAGAVLFAGIRWGTFVAGGSDSYCYLQQALRFADGQIQVAEPLALEAPWPDAPLTFAPAGHVPSPTVPGASVPICPPGLSLAMAPLVVVGGRDAAFVAIPLFGALLVGAAYTIGTRFGKYVGLAAAVLTACSPPFLYQLVQPMSDVPAAALWVLAVALATGTSRHASAFAGLATGGAILMRPNLVVLAIPLFVFILFRRERAWDARLRAAAGYGLWCVPGIAVVALLNNALYGFPFSSGYGSLGTLFAAEHVLPNARRYLSWLLQAHTPAVAIAAAAPALLPGPLTWLLAAMFLVNLGCYLPYLVFDDWSYLRFLLPTTPLLIVLLVASTDALCRRVRPRAAVPVVLTLTSLLAVAMVREAGVRSAFRLRQLEARYARAGEFVNRRLPPNAVVITSWESGSVRFYSGRLTLVWDALDPTWLEPAIDYLRGRGLEPFFLFERWEEPQFRRRFASAAIGGLDWPPMAEIAAQVRVYRPDDRERYLRSESRPTEYVR